MLNPTQLIQSYRLNSWLIDRQAADLTHEDSLVQLPFRANCFNWVLGHMLVSRDRVLRLLGTTPVLAEAQTALYETDSAPITQGSQAVALAELLKAAREFQTRLEAALPGVSPDQLNAMYDEERGQSVADRIRGLHWHESYHLGQLEILRQAAGKDDKVV